MLWLTNDELSFADGYNQDRMKRWLLLISTVIIVVTLAAAVRSHVKSVVQEKREIAYRSVLQKYSNDLAPGLRRTEVESYLRARNAHFSWIYTAFGGRRESQYAMSLRSEKRLLLGTAARHTSTWLSNSRARRSINKTTRTAGKDRDISTIFRLSLTAGTDQHIILR